MGFERIIVGYAGDDSSRGALRLAALLRGSDAAELIVTHVHTDDVAMTVFAAAQAQLPYGAVARFRTVRSHSVAHGLGRLAEREHADLIVVGSSPRGTSQGERLLHS